ncbi:MAG: alcohol dehydrogenase [Rhodospirillaceae bacterium]|nr:MAG: alcohol dehydrogenase [Rhodospirillaceae bacterium]
MRVAVFTGPGKPIAIECVADPQPGRDELLVKICRCGICGSDVSMTSEGPFSYPIGCRLGHEYSGEVVEVGRDVTAMKVGDRVACLPILGCGKCDGCRGGNAIFCTAIKSLSGGFGEYISVPPRAAVLLPQSLSLADGALIEPMACGLHALRMAGMRGGERILVLGAGTMALSIVYWARVLGAGKIVALSRSAHRRDIVLAMGADAVHAFDTDDPKSLAEALGGLPDIVAECIGKQGQLNNAIDHVRPQGTVIAMGMCSQGEPIVAARCTFKEVRMLFPLGYTVGEFAETANAFDSGRVRPELMVSDVIPLEDLPATLEKLRAGAKSLKIHVDPSLSGPGRG